MCWKSKEKKTPQIAGEGIFVYKVMYRKPDNGRFRSLYRRMDYEPEKIYWTDVNPISIDSPLYSEMMIENGFHSYSIDKTIAIKDNESQTLEVICMVNRVMIDSIFFPNNLVIAECIIPEGSKYYENDLGEIVSNRIIITGETIAFD